MILATRDDYEYPHIDWICDVCGAVYVSSGKPDTDYCAGGHHEAQWSPEAEQIAEYMDLLESLEVGDGIVVCGWGPAPLMGPVKSVGENEIVTKAIDSPSRTVRWDRKIGEIEWAKTDDEYQSFRSVYHVGTVDVLSAAVDGETAAKASTDTEQ